MIIRPELISKPINPTVRNDMNRSTVLSLTLKLNCLFNKKLVIIPHDTPVVFAIIRYFSDIKYNNVLYITKSNVALAPPITP